MTFRLSLATLALLAAAQSFAPARAAESYANCTGFIDSLPAIIDTQGTWCLRKDLATAISSGYAIWIETNNATIDCNHFKVGGLAGGAATSVDGIQAPGGSANITVRNCTVRGFNRGISLSGNGMLVEDNRLDQNTLVGVQVSGNGNVVRRNLITDTGGSTFARGQAWGIHAGGSADIIDNTVNGVAPAPDADGKSSPIGIYGTTLSGTVSGNRVRALLREGSGIAYGIRMDNNQHLVLRDNDLAGMGAGRGIHCSSPVGVAKGNVVQGFTTSGISNCTDGGNVVATE